MYNPYLGPYHNPLIEKLANDAQSKAYNFQLRIDGWCDQSFKRLENEHVDPRQNINNVSTVWVVKYNKSKYLQNFFKESRKLNVSLGSKYTWGDALYVAPIYSSSKNTQIAY